jgi:hypothetical protein
MNRLLFVLLLLLSANVEATQQASESFVTSTGTKAMLADPLAAARESDPALWIRFTKYLPKQTCSALWRGYIGTWDVSDGYLRLLSVRTNDCKESREVPLSDLFPGTHGPVSATWYTGELVFEVGPYVPGPCGFSPTCPSEYEVVLINKGRVAGSERRKPSR